MNRLITRGVKSALAVRALTADCSCSQENSRIEAEIILAIVGLVAMSRCEVFMLAPAVKLCDRGGVCLTSDMTNGVLKHMEASSLSLPCLI